LKKKKVIFLTIAGILTIGSATWAWAWYDVVNGKALDVDAEFELLIYPGSQLPDVILKLKAEAGLRHPGSFQKIADYMNYSGQVKPGRYLLQPQISNVELIRRLRSGEQDAVRVTIPTKRSLDEIAMATAKNLLFGPDSLKTLLKDTSLLASFGVSHATAFALFIPDTYFIFWNTSAREFLNRMKSEADSFWNEKRMGLSSRLSMSREEITTLASIVQAESARQTERPTIAGVYINRLKKGWKLQADPTVIFATGDFSIRRVLYEHLEFDSPYNTYKYEGLPPGPINNPEPGAMDAVLEYKEHDYMFFCARDDFSGYHHFSQTLKEHLEYARQYQEKLNRRGQ